MNLSALVLSLRHGSLRHSRIASLCLLVAGCGADADTETGAPTDAGTPPSSGGSSSGGSSPGAGGLALEPGAGGSGGSAAPSTGGTGGLPEATGGALGTGGDLPGSGGAPGPVDGSGGTSGSTSFVIEEDTPGFCSVDGIIESTNGGFSGTGYLNTDNSVSSTIVWSVSASASGTYSLSVVYANGGDDRSGEWHVDGTPVGEADSFSGTGAWTTWSKVERSLSLGAGTHTITLSATSAGGLPNIDRIEISGAAVQAAACPIEEEPDGSEPITVFLAGDSTVANGLTPCPSGWGKFFDGEFNENVTVQNSAVGGRSVRTWLYDVTDVMGGNGECIANTDGMGNLVIQSRWTAMLEQMSEGDYLFIQFGINDGSSTCPRHVGGGAFKAEYAMMAQAAFERGAQPVFLTPVSAIACSGSTAVGSRGFLTETFDVGATEGVPVIDLHALSIQLYQQLGFCPVPGGDVSSGTTGPVGDFFCDDHTHFSDVGALEIARLVADAVSEAGLSLSAYRNP